MLLFATTALKNTAKVHHVAIAKMTDAFSGELDTTLLL